VTETSGVTETPAKPPIRVAILADSRLFSEGLRRICAADASLVVVGEASLATAREVIRIATPDILLADGHIAGILTVCRELRRDRARPWAILLAAESDDDWAMRVLEAGARGVLTKSATAEDFVKAIHVVHEWQIWASERVMALIVEALATLSRETEATQTLLVQRLSSREQAIVRHAASGLSNQEIAERLNLSEATVKAHLTSIFRKLGVRDRAQLIARYPTVPEVAG
jgi:DNA-binding NarL/FixJ family response regulator